MLNGKAQEPIFYRQYILTSRTIHPIYDIDETFARLISVYEKIG